MGRKNSWRPRNGQPLSFPPVPGRVEIWIRARLAKMPEWFKHPLWGVIVGALIAFSGRQDLLLRSFGLFLVAVWLSVDIWHWLLRRHGRWSFRFVFGWSATSSLLIGVMLVMLWWLKGQIHDQQDDVYNRLTFSVEPNRNDPLRSFFFVRNGSGFDLGKHSMKATPHLVVRTNGTPVIIQTGTYKLSFECGGFSDSLGGGAETQTYPCLQNISVTGGVSCVDTDITLDYTLLNQPNELLTKSVRFVADARDGFLWHPQPTESPYNFCASFLSKPGN